MERLVAEIKSAKTIVSLSNPVKELAFNLQDIELVSTEGVGSETPVEMKEFRIMLTELLRGSDVNQTDLILSSGLTGEPPWRAKLT